ARTRPHRPRRTIGPIAQRPRHARPLHRAAASGRVSAFASLAANTPPSIIARSITMAAPMSGTQAPGYYRFKVGDHEVTVLSDGSLALECGMFAGDEAGAEKLL